MPVHCSDPGKFTKLWCPILTHYDSEGGIDSGRMVAHLRHLSRSVNGILVPGSTGDGWELSQTETNQVLGIILDQAHALNLQLLIGVLKHNGRETVTMIQEVMSWLKKRTTEREAGRALSAAQICGFTICAPRGKELGQDDIERDLTLVLELGLPTAIYQLPQITQNEISPELAANLANRFENFVFFKDSSGADRVVRSGKDLGSVFTMRGAEGNYARWIKTTGGPYDGFLLSTANCFARELQQIIDYSVTGREKEADQLSGRVTDAVNEVFRMVRDLPDGNAFTNANKAMDHFFAHGPDAASLPPPRLHAGSYLPAAIIHSTGDVLSRNQFMPTRGYLKH